MADSRAMIGRIEDLCLQIQPEAMALLELLVNTNSLTANLEGLGQNARIIREAAAEYGFLLESVPLEVDTPPAVHLALDCDHGPDEPFFGIVGHFDTVHRANSGFDRLRKDGGLLYGPGVQDMKSGVVASLYSLVVLKRLLGRDSLPVKVVYNCDEETGSLDSRRLIRERMAGARAVFVFEGRYDKDNALVTSRKGIMMGRLETRGNAAHAGENPERGASAVVEMAHKILKLAALNDPGRGDTVTVGTINGGEVANQIPALCRAELDVRFSNQERGAKLEKDIAAIMAEQHVPGVETIYSLTTARPPFVQTAESKKLFEAYRAAAAEFGQKVAERGSGGGSDANLTGAMGIPTIDGLGPAGDAPHTDHEYIEAESLTASIKAFALMMVKLIDQKERK